VANTHVVKTEYIRSGWADMVWVKLHYFHRFNGGESQSKGRRGLGHNLGRGDEANMIKNSIGSPGVFYRKPNMIQFKQHKSDSSGWLDGSK
jgi:hypothetical protein